MVPDFLPTAYIYMNGFILAFGVWALVAPESVESVFMVSEVVISSFTVKASF